MISLRKAFISCLVLLACLMQARAQAYRPFVEDGKEWLVVQGTYRVNYTKTYYTAGDTIVGSQPCKKLMLRHENHATKAVATSLQCCIFEEDRRVWYFPADCAPADAPILMYDFNALPGDTVALGGRQGFYHHVTCFRVWKELLLENGAGVFPGQLATVYDPELTDVDEDSQMPLFEWYEGIGSTLNPFDKTYWNKYMAGAVEQLYSCTVAGERIYFDSHGFGEITSINK